MKPRSSRLIPSTGKLLAAVPAIVCASQAKAQIVYTELNPRLDATNIYFNLDGSLVTTSLPGSFQFQISQKFGIESGNSTAVFAYPGGISTSATIFSAGDLIDFDPIANGSNGSNLTGLVPSGFTPYLGLAVNVNGQWDYGWAEVAIGSSPATDVALYGFAYDTTGAGILAGQTAVVPEPDSTTALAGLLAGSVAAFVALRKRKTAAAA